MESVRGAVHKEDRRWKYGPEIRYCPLASIDGRTIWEMLPEYVVAGPLWSAHIKSVDRSNENMGFR
jgi:hypothetical protein